MNSVKTLAYSITRVLAINNVLSKIPYLFELLHVSVQMEWSSQKLEIVKLVKKLQVLIIEFFRKKI